MRTMEVYNPAELKELFPDAYEKAYDKWQADSGYDVPWMDEIMESLKGLIKSTYGISLRDWSIGPYSHSYIRLEWDNDSAKDLEGQRALAWIENNLFSRLRIKANSKDYYRYNGSYRSCDSEHLKRFGQICRPYTIGKIPPCPFTGYCADEDFIDALLNSVTSGMNLKDSFNNLADTAMRLMEAELEYQSSEESFLERDYLEYTSEGRLV